MPEHMHPMMTLLPRWVRLAWVITLAVIAAVHISRRHHGRAVALVARRAHRHGGEHARHACRDQRDLDRALVVDFAIIIAAIAAAAALVGRREGRLNPLWVATGVDTAAMIYMAAVMASPSAAQIAVTWIVVAYLGGQSLAWPLGVWDHVLVHRSSLGLSGHISIDIRLSLAAMAAGMAYMLAAMTS
jgi:hypothetical protein